MNNDQPQLSIQSTIVTKAQLNSIGISLPDDQMQALIQHVEETINERISEEVVESLSDDQLKELVKLQTSNAPAEEIDTWIREHISEYDEIIEDNVAIVLGELVENSDAIQK
jgi:hypothetical protein